MIRLFVSDIDGCLSEPYQPYDLDGFKLLSAQAHAAGLPGTSAQPALSICSGRAYAYVEAVTQALGIRTPVLFESGGGMFDPVAAQTTWNPAFTDEVARQLGEVRRWFVADCVPGTKMSLDHAKQTQAGVVTPDTDEVRDLHPKAERFVEDNGLDLNVYFTDNSVDVAPPTITKKTGIAWLASSLGLDVSAVAYIGDTDADLEALRSVGHSFAPVNAHEVVREHVTRVTEGAVLQGTIEAYRWCLAYNEAAQPNAVSS